MTDREGGMHLCACICVSVSVSVSVSVCMRVHMSMCACVAVVASDCVSLSCTRAFGAVPLAECADVGAQTDWIRYLWRGQCGGAAAGSCRVPQRRRTLCPRDTTGTDPPTANMAAQIHTPRAT
jgi:hypothetical protein